jgi:enoyl-CoA hydratase
MVYQNVTLEVKNTIAEVVLKRPEKRNAINNQMGEELIEVFTICSRNKNIHVLILGGEGKSFCAGIALSELPSSNKTAAQHYMDLEENVPNKVFRTMKSIRKPIIAAAHGYTLGAGLGLIALSHFVGATEDARFGLPEINFGLFPLGVIPFLWQVIGPKRAMQLGLLGEQISAGEACRIGLIDYLVPADGLMSKAWELADKLNKKNPMALLAGIDSYNMLVEEEFWKYFKILGLLAIPFVQLKGGNQSK